jgi:hypothetical protein
MEGYSTDWGGCVMVTDENHGELIKVLEEFG